MIKRSLRVGIRLGLLAGIVFAVLKLMQGRRPALPVDDATDAWTSAVPTTPPAKEAELVEPTMLTSVGRGGEGEQEPPSALTSLPEAARGPSIDPGPTVVPTPEPASPAPPAKQGTVEKVPPAKKAAAKKAAKKATGTKATPAKKAAAKKAAPGAKAPGAKAPAAKAEKPPAKKAGTSDKKPPAPRKRTPPPGD